MLMREQIVLHTTDRWVRRISQNLHMVALISLLFGSMCISCDHNDDEAEARSEVRVKEGFAQSEDCLRYLTCMKEVDSDNAYLYEETYGEGGECWSQGSVEALACTQTCQAGMEVASVKHPTTQQCWEGATPDMFLIFGESEDWKWTPQEECSQLSNVRTSFWANTSGADFSMTFTAWSKPGQRRFNFDQECIQDGLTFSCIPYENAIHGVWVLSGAFSNGFVNATLELQFYSYFNEQGDFACKWMGTPKNGA